jgi:hypothetical protein
MLSARVELYALISWPSEVSYQSWDGIETLFAVCKVAPGVGVPAMLRTRPDPPLSSRPVGKKYSCMMCIPPQK